MTINELKSNITSTNPDILAIVKYLESKEPKESKMSKAVKSVVKKVSKK